MDMAHNGWKVQQYQKYGFQTLKKQKLSISIPTFCTIKAFDDIRLEMN